MKCKTKKVQTKSNFTMRSRCECCWSHHPSIKQKYTFFCGFFRIFIDLQQRWQKAKVKKKKYYICKNKNYSALNVVVTMYTWKIHQEYSNSRLSRKLKPPFSVWLHCNNLLNSFLANPILFLWFVYCVFHCIMLWERKFIQW